MDWMQIGIYILVGFAAQLVDGSLGMAYGVSANTFLLSTGVPAAAASASVHIAEVFTTATSGLAHFKRGNINRGMVKRLILPGIAGGITGAYLLTQFPGDLIKPYISAYLLVMGLRILYKAWHRTAGSTAPPRHLAGLALVGGFFDAVGGGGWGPIVTTTLLANGSQPRETIGSVNTAEFFVTFAEALTFISILGLTNWTVILGLIIGGVLAAPLGALLAHRLPTRPLMALVGLLICILSLRTIWLAF